MSEPSYTINSVAASMRLLVLASSLRDEVDDATMQMLHGVATQKGLGVEALVRIVAEHEQAVDALNPSVDQCFDGRRHLPKALVEQAVDAITEKSIQLDLAAVMMRLVTAGDEAHDRSELLFVEYCVGRWGIRDEWHAYLNEV
jgi:hypothetical protein